ncbi:uncharacterized protein [Nicotiana tomentosiformis]|uniref:uncharacterized protein n=1 Tax=Nicotiana tomentosiformis TaxID=4098 RepID=UPI00388CC861
MQDHINLRNDFQFTDISQVSSNGLSGGIVILWHCDLINVDELRMSEQDIHCMVQLPNVKRAQLQLLCKEFEIPHMKAGETVNEFFARTLTMANKLKANGEDNGDDTSTITIDELQSSLLVHEQRMSSPIVDEQALKIAHGEQSGGRNQGFGRGRGRFDKTTVEFYSCHKLGHFQWEYLQKEKVVNYAETHGEMLLMAYVDSGANDKDTWFLDSGCNNHMCGKKEYFFDFDGRFRDSVKLGNNLSLSVIGKGNIRLQVKKTTQVITTKRHGAWFAATQVSSEIIKDCLVGKQQCDPFPKKSNWRASQVLQLIYADICGPIKPISNSKKRYLLTFIDYFSRKLWVYFLIEMSEAFAIFKRFKTYIEKETNSFIRGFHTYRGEEFTSQEFSSFCDENGIKRQLTTPYTPQQNVVVERKNRIIMNMVRSMLSEKKLPKIFWPEAVNWIVHVFNWSPTLSIKNKTPEEALSGNKHSVEYFRVFGCLSHVHVSDNTRSKLDDKSLCCVLLGVSEQSKAYRLYDPISQRIIISRDVMFEEDRS